MTLAERENAVAKNSFLQRLLQLEQRDHRIFRQVGISDQLNAKVGISPLRNFVFNWCWKFLSLNEIPKLSRAIQGDKNVKFDVRSVLKDGQKKKKKFYRQTDRNF